MRPETSRSVEHGLSPARWRWQLGRALAMGDALVIALSSAGAYAVREFLGRTQVLPPLGREIPIALAIIPLWLLIFYLAGAYRAEYLNAGSDAFRRFTGGVVTGVLSIGFISFVFNLQLSRLFVGFLAVLVFVLGGGLRVVTRRHIGRRQRRGELKQRTIVVGTDADARELAHTLNASRDSSYVVIGFLSDEALSAEEVDGTPVLGRAADVLDAAHEHAAGLIVVSPAGVGPGTLRDIIIALEGADIDVAVAPSLFQVVTRRMTIETVSYVPLLHVDQIRLRRGKAFLKRSLDLVAAASLGLLTAPIWIVAALAIRMDSDGPVLFRQERAGRDGRSFSMLKFRTMDIDAEQRLGELEHLNEADGHFFKMADDPRVTRPGRTLRRWSIDELPQLINVLRGEMSMVGPRPPLLSEVERYEPWQLRRLRIRPGLTGVWQVSGRSDVGFDEAVRLDLFYIENWSLGYDLYLLSRTVTAVLSRRGAW